MKNCSSGRQNYKFVAFFPGVSPYYHVYDSQKKNQHYDSREEFKTGKATVNLRGKFWKQENCKMGETQNLNVNSVLMLVYC